MLDLEEKNEVVSIAVEKMKEAMPEILAKFEEKLLLSLPEIIGNLIVNHIALSKISAEFYSKHKEFRNDKELVASVVEMMDMQHPEVKDYRELYELAIPEIQKQLAVKKSLNMTTVPEPNRDLHGRL